MNCYHTLRLAVTSEVFGGRAHSEIPLVFVIQVLYTTVCHCLKHLDTHIMVSLKILKTVSDVNNYLYCASVIVDRL